MLDFENVSDSVGSGVAAFTAGSEGANFSSISSLLSGCHFKPYWKEIVCWGILFWVNFSAEKDVTMAILLLEVVVLRLQTIYLIATLHEEELRSKTAVNGLVVVKNDCSILV